jgi:hypothetical protein
MVWRRYSFASESREIASHHCAAGTLTETSPGPFIQPQERSLISLTFLVLIFGGSEAFACSQVFFPARGIPSPF